MTNIEQRIKEVAEIITDYWPHRMSQSAATTIDKYYRDRVMEVFKDGKGLNLARLRFHNSKRCAEWMKNSTEPWSLADKSNEMMGEAGEAANIVKKMRRIQTGVATGVTRGDQATFEFEDLRERLGEELADVIITADLLADAAGIDLSDAVVAKFNATSMKNGLSERLVR